MMWDARLPSLTGRLCIGMVLAGLALAPAISGCSKSERASADEVETLPPLVLTDDTPEVVLTWIDPQGAAHTSLDVSKVPEDSRQTVRVTTKNAGHGKLFYVANLSQKRADGSYPVATMPRQQWEARLDKLRQKQLAAHPSPPAQGPGRHGPRGNPPGAHGQPATGVNATVYGASWCKPCHQAADYMKRRGVTVTEHDIEKTPGKQREMHAKLRKAGRSGGSIPVIDVQGTILVGYSTRAIDRAIDRALAGTHL